MASADDITQGDGSNASIVNGASMFGSYSPDTLSGLDDATIQSLESDQLAQSSDAQQMGTTWEFDFVAGQFVMRGQSVATVSGDDALVQWCQIVLSTERYTALAAPDDIGIESEDIIRGLIHPNAVLATIGQRIKAALTIHPLINDVTNVKLTDSDGRTLQVSYTIQTTAGSVSAQGVIGS